jgi:hypothetical protein
MMMPEKPPGSLRSKKESSAAFPQAPAVWAALEVAKGKKTRAG